MKTPQNRRWIWTTVPQILEQGHDVPVLRRPVLREPGQGDTAAGTILRLRQRLGPLAACAREVDVAGV
jgi:hypothetical protein